MLNLTDDAGESIGSATGFLVAPDAVLTNAHVANRGKIIIRLGSFDIPCAIERTDPINDLALCRMTARSAAAPIVLAPENPRPGAVVFAVGNPRGLEKTITQGLFTGLRELDGHQVAQMSASISPGSSGGPILNGAGELVGVAVSSLVNGQSLNFAVPLEITRAFLANKNSSTDTAETLLTAVGRLLPNAFAYSSDADSDYQQQEAKISSLLMEAARIGTTVEVLEQVYSGASELRPEIQAVAARRMVSLSRKPTRDLLRRLAEALYYSENEIGPDVPALVEAEAAASRAVEMGGGKVASDLMLLGGIQSQAEKVAPAILSYERAFLNASDPSERNNAAFQAFRIAHQNGRPAQADSWAARLVPENLRIFQLSVFADYLEERNRFRESANAHLLAAQQLPKVSRYQCSAGRVFWRANMDDEALSANRQCIALASTETGSNVRVALAHRAIAAILNGRQVFDQAESHAKQSIQIVATDEWAFEALADAQLGQGRATEAVASARTAIRLADGKWSSGHFSLGSALFDLRQFAEAAKSFEKAAELDPSDSGSAYNVAVSYLNARFDRDALRWYRETLRRNPQHPQRDEINRQILRLSK